MTNKSRAGKNQKKVGEKIPAIFTFRHIFLSLIEKGKTLDEIQRILSSISTQKAPCLKKPLYVEKEVFREGIQH